MIPFEWMDRALCASVDPELFYPEEGSNGHAAKRVCVRCPVREECLSHALATGDVWHGIRAALSPEQRRARLTDHFRVSEDVDLAVVFLCTDERGKRERTLTHDEAATAARLLQARGLGPTEIENVYGIKVERYAGES